MDGVSYSATQTFQWTPGSGHTIAISSPQAGAPGTQYVWASWSDGGGATHAVTTPTAAATYTASFSTAQDFTLSSLPTQYLLPGVTNPAPATVTVSPVNGFNQNVVFSASNAPPGISVSFSPSSVAPNTSTQVSFEVAAGTAPGTYNVALTATAGSLQHTKTASVFVPDVAQIVSEFLTPLDDGTVYAFFTSYFIGSDADMFSSQITRHPTFRQTGRHLVFSQADRSTVRYHPRSVFRLSRYRRTPLARTALR